MGLEKKKMSTEFEYKYILRMSSELRETIIKNKIESRRIKQGYLFTSNDMVTRIRSSTNLKNDELQWFLTLKKKTRIRLIEIETEIDSIDGEELFEFCDKKVEKIRDLIKHNELIFEVDFFINLEIIQGWYFVMVEVEVKLNSERPKLPDFLQKHLLYEVPLTDNRFSNTNLGDVNYTSNLYKELIMENSNEIKI